MISSLSSVYIPIEPGVPGPPARGASASPAEPCGTELPTNPEGCRCDDEGGDRGDPRADRFNRSKEWAARNRGLEFGYYDFATEYRVSFSPLPAFRDVAPEEYRRKVAALIGEIEQEGEQKRERDDDTVAGVEKILSQDPYEPPTRRPKTSARPVFHFRAADAKETFMSELKGFIEEYRHASEALQSGQMEAVQWFPEGSYRPQLPFLGSPAPPRPPSPPTRPIEIEETEKVKRVVARGAVPVVEVPVVEMGGRVGSASADHPT